jgi:hypothetical protein
VGARRPGETPYLKRDFTFIADRNNKCQFSISLPDPTLKRKTNCCSASQQAGAAEITQHSKIARQLSPAGCWKILMLKMDNIQWSLKIQIEKKRLE